MTALQWAQVGERRFETGLDRGVIYPMDETPAVVWSGLIQIDESRSREVKSYYVDGVKYLDYQVIGAYSATVKAFMYPEKLEELTGTMKYAPGVFLHDQAAKPFHMSYRTLIGNDLEGVDHGYVLHLIYNVLAAPANLANATMGEQVVPNVFEFALSATPPQVWGIRPTAHISIHVTPDFDSELLENIEALLYGTELLDPSFPDLTDLLTLVEGG